MAGRLSVRVTGPLGAPAARVWASAGDFNGLPGWVPGILASRQEGKGVGQIRHLEIKWRGPQFAIERQDARDDAAFDQSYSIVESSLPVTRYTSRFRLVPSADGERCTLEWSAAFDPKDGAPKDGAPKDGAPKDGAPKDGAPKDGAPKDGAPKDGATEDEARAFVEGAYRAGLASLQRTFGA